VANTSDSRSKRGVGKAALDFNTKELAAYRIEGGGHTVKFEPESCRWAL